MVVGTEITPLLTVKDVARILHVHINTVQRWSNKGVLRTYRISSRGDRRFRREDVIKFLIESLSPNYDKKADYLDDLFIHI